MKRIDYACSLIFDEAKEKIVMVRNRNQDSSYWSIPTGAVEAGESLEQAVIRETKEETGLTIRVTGLYSVREVFFTNLKQHALLFTFLAKIIDGQIQISDPDREIVEVKWMDLQTANQFMTYLPDHLDIVAEDSSRSAIYYFHGEE